ncbi:bola-like protein [Mollisia scopiformis]|uniref:Bola-like protein n=1 Tax=Mollisia scopiformis TaxID=149040 RepID=A0A194XF24_MOLSC|nr:bola-like protein [Mollisia scopiformis]KUJ18751.1 bola-like protein [Mollisia scopiformis]
MASQTPMEDIMRSKLTAALSPTKLEIHNDSHKHAHHQAMANSTSAETHFRVLITSEAFKGKMQPARHRMVYALLKEEMAREAGIHALQLRTKTVEEDEKALVREKEEEEGKKDAGVMVEGNS